MLPSPCACAVYLCFGCGGWAAAFWEGVAHSVDHVLLCGMSACDFGYFPFWFRDQDFGSACTNSWSFLNFHFQTSFLTKAPDQSNPKFKWSILGKENES